MLPPAPPQFPVLVVGGGISGLACAYRLHKLGLSVRLLEAADHVGGVISTRELDGFRFELGPQSFLSTPPLLELVDELGLTVELLHANPRAPRYIYSRGRLVAAPLSPPALLTTPLLASSTKWRLVKDLLGRTRPPSNDESVAAFVRRKFGSELLDRMVGPFVSGVYAGDPEKLSLRAAFPKLHEFETEYGSILRGAAKAKPSKNAPKTGLCSFRAGMASLPRALGEQLGDAVSRGTIAKAIACGSDGEAHKFEVHVEQQGRDDVIRSNAVVIAAPTMAAAAILSELIPKCADAFGRIEYAPVAVIASGYRRDQIKHPLDGFGFLVPRSEGLRVLGTVWNSSLFPGRAASDMVCLTSFAGGATDPGLFSKSDTEIVDTVHQDVARTLGISGPPVTCVVERYRHAIPQYNLGHSDTVSELESLIASVPGLFLTGNYLAGPSIGSCVEHAHRTAVAAQKHVASLLRR